MKVLKQLGFLQGSVKGPLNWTSGGQAAGSISLEVYVREYPRYMRLQYSISNPFFKTEKAYNYLIPIESFPSNLGKGFRYYFICPKTEKRCIKLYMPPGATIFAHRDHWQELYYENQVKSKRFRTIGKFFDLERKLQNTSTRYMKRHYRGEFTPRYKAYLADQHKIEKYHSEAMKALTC